jgi:hypothetical protein
MLMRAITTIIVAVLLSCLSTGCASRHVTISYVESRDEGRIHQTYAKVAAHINGVSGHFIVDTGASGSFLSMTAVRRCGIEVSPSRDYGSGVGSNVALLQATNITVQLAPDVDIHWPRVLVIPDDGSKQVETNSDFFGLLGYPTLAARQTVIDMKRKTLTMMPNPPPAGSAASAPGWPFGH